MNSSCVREGVLQTFLDGELGEQRANVAAHVSRCARCASTLEKLKMRTADVERLFASLDDETVQAAVVALPRRSWPRWMLAGAALAACLVIATASLLRLMKPGVQGTTRAGTATAPTNAFILQPGAQQPLPTEALMIVRVEVPVSALPPDATTLLPGRNTTVLTDVLMGEDGTTYGMRLADTGGY